MTTETRGPIHASADSDEWPERLHLAIGNLPEIIGWMQAGEWVAPGLFQPDDLAEQVGAYVRRDLHDALLAETEALRRERDAMKRLLAESGMSVQRAYAAPLALRVEGDAVYPEGGTSQPQGIFMTLEEPPPEA